jgi:hypothetical protein
MRRLTLPRPTYANVVATLALVFALGGTAYAAATVGTADIQDGAVTTPKLANEAVSNAKLAPGSVNAGSLGSNAVTSTKIAASSVGSVKIADNSVTLADLKGIDRTGSISFSLAAHSCGTLNISASGMVAGQVALISWRTTPPANVVFSPLQVVSTTQVSLRACNEGASSVSASNVGIRLITFG